MIIRFLILVFLSLCSTVFAKNVLWEGNPIPVDINVSEEKRIDFPEAIVDLNVHSTIQRDSEILLTPEGRLFWKPKTDYGKARVKAISVTGTLYLLDINTMKEGASQEEIQIIDPVLGSTATHNKIGTETLANRTATTVTKKSPSGLPNFLNRNNAESKKKVGNDFVGMSRFALAHFTGPSRLIPKLEASRVSVGGVPNRFIRVFGHRLQIKPLRGWLIDGHYVTALSIKNRGGFPIDFDPRAIRGNFEFIATLNSRLEAKGVFGDEGIWVLISDQPFSKAAKE